MPPRIQMATEFPVRAVPAAPRAMFRQRNRKADLAGRPAALRKRGQQKAAARAPPGLAVDRVAVVLVVAAEADSAGPVEADAVDQDRRAMEDSARAGSAIFAGRARSTECCRSNWAIPRSMRNRFR